MTSTPDCVEPEDARTPEGRHAADQLARSWNPTRMQGRDDIENERGEASNGK